MGAAEFSLGPHSTPPLPQLSLASFPSGSVDPRALPDMLLDISEKISWQVQLLTLSTEQGLTHGGPVHARQALGTSIWSRFKCPRGWTDPLAPLPAASQHLLPAAVGLGWTRERFRSLGKLLGRVAVLS